MYFWPLERGGGELEPLERERRVESPQPFEGAEGRARRKREQHHLGGGGAILGLAPHG